MRFSKIKFISRCDGINLKILFVSDFDSKKALNSQLLGCFKHLWIEKHEFKSINFFDLRNNSLSHNKPDYTIFLGSFLNEIDLIEEFILTSNSKTALWSFEDPYEFKFNIKFQNIADAYISNDPAILNQPKKRAKNIYSPVATCQSCLPNIYSPDKINRILFVGSPHQERVELFKSLFEIAPHFYAKLDFVGERWEDIFPNSNTISKFLSRDKAFDLYARYLVNLNIERFSDINGNFLQQPNSALNTRILEIGGAGGAIVSLNSGYSIYNSHLSSKDLVVTTNLDNLKKSIEFILNNPSHSQDLGRNLKLKVAQYYTLNLIVENVIKELEIN